MSIGGGGSKISSRMLSYDYANGAIIVKKSENRGKISIRERNKFGERIPNIKTAPRVNINSNWGLDVGYTFMDSHPNEIGTINVPEEIKQYLNEYDAVLAVVDRPTGFGGDPEYGVEFIESVIDSFISNMSLYRGNVVWVNMSADGGTAMAMGSELLKYKNEIHGKDTPYLLSISIPPRQYIRANIRNIEYNKKEIGDYIKRGYGSAILYSLDYAKMVSQYNEIGKIIDEDLIDTIYNRAKPPLSTFEENADLEFVKATAPLRYIMMGSNEYHKIYRGAIVDAKDVFNRINGKVVIPCYLTAKNINELAERVSLLDDPLCYENGDIDNGKPLPEAGIASTIYNCMSPLPYECRIDRVLYIVKMTPGMELEFSNLIEKTAEFASCALGVKSDRVDVWTFEGDSTNRDIECWAYIIVDDYKGYVDESIREYIGKL
jgi:hypothetical protein